MITIPVYGVRGKLSESLQFDSNDLVRKEVSPKTFACAIRMFFQNWRQGTVGCKSRGELAFSNKKPWRQKGTGRARVSSIRSPLWRKGGVIFGPQPRVRELFMNKRQGTLVLNNLLFTKLDAEAIQSFDFVLENNKPSAKMASDMLQRMSLFDKKVVLFLTHDDELTFASFRNLPNVSIVLFDQPNAYHLSNAAYWIFLKKDFDLFKDMVVQWN